MTPTPKEVMDQLKTGGAALGNVPIIGQKKESPLIDKDIVVLSITYNRNTGNLNIKHPTNIVEAYGMLAMLTKSIEARGAALADGAAANKDA